jgi:hypothetical protein
MVFSAIPTDMDAVCSAMMWREIKEKPAKIDAAACRFGPRVFCFSADRSSSSSDLLPRLFFFMVLLQQFEQAIAHDHSRPIRWHVLFDLPAHVHDGIGVG